MVEESALGERRFAAVLVALVLALAVLAPLPGITPLAHAATLTVDTNDPGCDNETGLPYCHIGAALGDASPGDLIDVAAGTYFEAISIFSDVTIQGAGAGSTIIDPGEGGGTMVTISGTPTVTINDLTIQNGGVFGNGGGINATGDLTLERVEILGNGAGFDGAGLGGGGIYFAGTNLTVTDSLIENNYSEGDGGGMYIAAGDVDIFNTTITGNAADVLGGGLYIDNDLSLTTIDGSTISNNDAPGGGPLGDGGGGVYVADGDLTVTFSSFTGNTSADSGGAIHFNRGSNTGVLSITGSTFTDNSVGNSGGAIRHSGTGSSSLFLNSSTIANNVAGGDGGGIASDGNVFIENSTISSNTAGGDGGGFWNEWNLEVRNSTLVLNHADGSGGGILNFDTIDFANTVAAANTAGSSPDCDAGDITSHGYNFISKGGCLDSPLPTDQVGSPGSPLNPMLSVLQDNGGPTLTHLPLPGSPLIDAGNPVDINADPWGCTLVDQRGTARPQGPQCDIGPVEVTDGSVAVAISGPPATTEPGASVVSVDDIPPSALTGISSTPISSVPISSVPISSVPISSVPISSVPISSVPISSVPISTVPISSVPISSVPLSCPDPLTWDELLVGTPFEGQPLQTVILQDLLDLSPPIDCLQELPLLAFDFSSTVLGQFSLAALSLGPIGIGDIPLSSGDPLADWCTFLFQGGFDCAANNVTSATTVAALDILGAPISSVPISSVLISSVSISSLPISSVLISSVPISSVETILDCDNFDCTAFETFGDAFNAGALRPEATFGDFFEALLPPELLPWDELDLEALGIQQYDPNSPVLPYVVDFSVSGDVSAPATVSVEMPDGFLYVTGSSTITITDEGSSTVVLDDPAKVENTLVWTTPFDVFEFTDYSLEFQAHPGLTLGTFDATATVQASDLSGAATGAAVEVIAAFEPDGDDPATAPLIGANMLVLSHVSESADEDFFSLEVPSIPGTRVTLTLTQQGADNDLLIYRPFAPELSAFDDRDAGVPTSPVEDPGINSINQQDNLAPETLQDVTILSSPISSVSANRDTADEQVDIVTTTAEAGEPTAAYTVQVTGYNGATSDQPYLLQASVVDAAGFPVCPSPNFPFADPGAPAATIDLANLPADLSTVFFYDARRLERRYGASEAGQVVADLQTMVDHLNGLGDPEVGALGLVAAAIDVEAVVGHPVSGLYDGWDTNPCNPEAANAVVTGITGIVEALHASNRPLRFITLAGGDEALPMERVPDLTTLSNERDYAGTFGTDTALYGALISEHVLSDDPYGDFDPIPWLDRQLFVPDVAVGRLLENPTEISAALTLFVDNDGLLNPQSALVSGYDFLSDGAANVASALNASLGSTPDTTLINDTWDKNALESTWLPPAPTPLVDVASINAHYDHFRAQPADASGGLFEVADLIANGTDPASGESRFTNRIIFSMGCHFGLPVGDETFAGGDARAQDWAQVYAQHGAISVGNTGFGYGDTAAPALSERLMTLFAERLDGSMAAGEALTFAKQDYIGGLGLYGVFDEKVLTEATFYGLPFYGLGGGGTLPPAPDPFDIEVDPSTGLDSASIEVTGIGFNTAAPLNDTVRTVTGFDVTDTVANTTATETPIPRNQVTHYRPIQPLIQIDVTPATGKAHGAIIEDLESIDTLGISPVVARPVIDLTANEPSYEFNDTIFPAVFHSITHYRDPAGERQRLVLIPGQFFTENPGDHTGTQRDYTAFDATVLYSTSTDFDAPIIEFTDAFVAGGTVNFVVDVDAGPGDDVTRVLVLFKDDTGTWTPVELTDAGGLTWTGNAAGVVGDRIEYFVQAADQNGNVAVSTNKARFYTARLVNIEATPTAADEGDTVTLTTAFTLPSSVGQVQLAIDWGDGNQDLDETPVSPQDTDHVYVDDGTYAVQGCVFDNAAFQVCDTTRVTISNVAPVVDAGPDISGADPSVSVAVLFTDPGLADTHEATIEWGDGDIDTISIPLGDRSFSAGHTYADDGTFLVTVTVDDGDAGGVDTVTVFIGNSPPVVDEATFDVDEDAVAGTSVGVATATDPDTGQTVQFAIVSGNEGGEFTIDGATGEITVAGSLDHETHDTFALTVEATDDGDPAAAGSATVTVLVNDVNEAPSVGDALFGISDDAAVGDAVGTVTASDPDEGDVLAFAITDGNVGSAFAIDRATGAVTVAAPLDASMHDYYSLTVEVTDNGGLTDIATVTIEVDAAGEAVVIESLAVEPVEPIELIAGLGADATATLTWSGDAVDIVFDWGDETTTQVSPGTGDTSSVAPHNYAEAGVFTVTATVTDVFGNVVEATYEFVVVYDPSAGFVTGSGKFVSPAGAWTEDPTITGDVKVGFNAKWKRGVPEGTVKVDVEDADVKFESIAIEWLVIAGDWAQVKGLGEFKDRIGLHEFLVTLIDGDLEGGDGIDLVRAHIWVAGDPDAVVYDSQLGDGAAANPTNPIDSGNLMIHQPRGPR